MRKKCSFIYAICMLCFLSICSLQVEAKTNIIPVDVKMYTTSGTPVYEKPDLNSKMIGILDRFINVTVTGITENGFYQVDLNGKFYIPGPFLVANLVPEKTAKQLALEQLDKITEAYLIQLDQMESYSSAIGLLDINGDSIPEIFDLAGKEIYTYYNEHAVMIYYNENSDAFYYSKKYNQLAGKYTWQGKEFWELFSFDCSLLPWGQLRCTNTDISLIKNDLQPVTHDYANDQNTRNELKNLLKKCMSLE